MDRDAIDHRLPRYERIRAAIAAAIADGTYAAGDAIPSEAELAHRYGVAVGTVRRAVDRLVEDGLIERAHGRGMFVRRADFRNSLFRFFRFGSGGAPRRPPDAAILERDRAPAPGAVRDALGLAAHDRAFRMVRLRSADGRVLLHEEIWLPERRFPGFLDLPVEALMPLLYPAYETLFRIGVARARERLSVESVGGTIARHLGADDGARVQTVRIERIALDHARDPVEWRVSHGRTEDFAYEIEVG